MTLIGNQTIFKVILIIFLFFPNWINFNYSKVYAVESCKSLFKISRTFVGAATELEMPINNAVLNILTTTDGTVGGLFKNTNMPLPDFYLKWAQKNFPLENPKSISWDLLDIDFNFKIALMKHAFSSLSANSFFRDRSIPNMTFKPYINLKFNEETYFLGSFYPPGEHSIATHEIFNRLEFLEPHSYTEASGTEIHLRSANISAGDLLVSSWILQKAIGDQERPMHEHIVAPIPKDSLTYKNLETSLIITEYYRLFNLLAEFITVGQHEGIYVSKTADWKINRTGFFRFKIKNNGWTNFGPIQHNYLPILLNYFLSQMNFKLGTYLKMGWVGFRGHDYYDQPGLFGFEWRSISEKDNPILDKKIADNVQFAMEKQRFNIDGQKMINWLNFKEYDLSDLSDINKLGKSWWYNIPFTDIKEKMPPYIKEVLGGPIISFLKISYLRFNASGNKAVKMLLYDWASDPLFFDDPSAKSILISAQQKALRDYFNKGMHLKEVIKNFVWTSGLLEKVLRTFNLSKSDFDHLYRN